MSLSATGYVIRIHLLILFIALTILSLTTFSSTIAHFAVIMRDYVRSGRNVPNHSMPSFMFENLMIKVLKSLLILALPSALLSLFGLVLVAYLRFLRQSGGARYSLCCIQFVESLAILFIGSYIASNIYGYPTLFAGLDDQTTRFLYYSMIYFGGIGLVIYGSMAVIYFVAQQLERSSSE